jgi:hypothetical protein
MIEMIKKNSCRGSNGIDADVLLSVVKSKNVGRQFALTFSKDAKKRVFKGCVYGTFGFASVNGDNRIYFSTSTQKDGFKLYCRNEKDTKSVMKTTVDERMKNFSVDEWAGYYDLEYDGYENMWYVSLKNKKIY